jgi:drug/metabolite transporter (DMT)-like permease
MNLWQWLFVLVVLFGLALTTTRSFHLGSSVVRGIFLVVFGSIMHAGTYVMCEAIMTVGEHRLTIRQNCAIQGMVAAFCFLLWQFVYTYPRFEEKIWEPMQAAESTIAYGLFVLALFALSNTVHSITFFHTLRHYPGGATSAGVMKGLQAVLVFVFTHWAYCGRIGGEEMCFTSGKFLSLVTVTGGVVGYGFATQKRQQSDRRQQGGYEEVDDILNVEVEPLVPID